MPFGLFDPSYLLVIPALALLVLNAGYGFEGSGRPLGSFAFLSPDLTRPRTGGEIPDHPNALYRLLYSQRENRFARACMRTHTRHCFDARRSIPLPRLT